jgi:hypothetical protein
MRRIFLLVLVMIAGCGRKLPPPANNAGSPSVSGQLQPVSEAPAAVVPASGPTFQGRSAPQWAAQLQTNDPNALRQASTALGELGEAGYVSLRDGLRDKSGSLRIACLQAISQPIVVAHWKEMLPLLTGLLQDREPAVRRAAAAKLCALGTRAQSAVPELRRLAENDPVADNRQVAQTSIELISQSRREEK